MDKSSFMVRRQVGFWRTLAVLLAVLSLCLVVAVVVLTLREREGDVLPTCGASIKDQVTRNKNTIDRSEPPNPGPFHDLTNHELNQVRAFLENDPNIKAVKSEDASMDMSVIYMMDLFLPPKSEVLNYLDHKGPQPDRQALVLMYRGDLRPPMVEEVICGPLPNVQECKLHKSDKRRNPVEFSLRPVSLMEYAAVYEFVLKEVDRKLGYILKESYGTSYADCPPEECFKIYPSPVGTNLVKDITKRRLWVWAMYPMEYYILHPVDFGVLSVLDGSEPSKFYVDKVWYHGNLYNSMDDLIVSYNASSLNKKSRVQIPQRSRDLFSSLNQRGHLLPEQPQRPPTLVEPDGRRYSLKGRKVSYQGWNFNFRMSALTGPALYDISYLGERIVYELCLSEIAVFYSGNSPLQRLTDFVDSGALIGSHSKSLVPGADCPESSTLVNVSFVGQATSKPVVLAHAFCLFENNNGYPLRRHLSYSKSEGSFYGGMLDSVLILRSALTIVNYDYIVDFIFHQNGVIETRIMSTGYILPTFYSKLEDPYGFNIENNLIGNVHHHMFHFKADVDLSGTSNRYETLDIVPETADMRTVAGEKYHQTKYVRSLKKTEKAALYKYDFDKPKYHVVHNEAKRTKYGAMKAYRIGLHGMSKNLMPEDLGNEISVSWARHQLVVTARKDEEMLGSSPYAMWDSYDPVTNFTTYYEDDENIVDEDLVFWITQGMHHIPHTEDIPLTPTVGNHLTFFLLPYNYFPQCPSVTSRDHIRIEHRDPTDPKLGVHVIRNGNSYDECIVPAVAKQYDELLANDPDLAVETLHYRGIL